MTFQRGLEEPSFVTKVLSEYNINICICDSAAMGCILILHVNSTKVKHGSSDSTELNVFRIRRERYSNYKADLSGMSQLNQFSILCSPIHLHMN